MTLQLQVDLIERFLHFTTEPFDDWEWDENELVIWLGDEPIERYLHKELKAIIKGFE